MGRWWWLGVFWWWGLVPSYAQSGAVRLRGTLLDTDGLPLPGATVYSPDLRRGSVADADGQFSLRLVARDSVTVTFSYVGFTAQTQTFWLGADTTVEVRLRPAILDEVTVEATGLREKLRSAQMSVETLSPREAKLLPALFGEVDIIKVLQLKPGIQSGGEGTTGLYVRGGGPDQNLILLDGTVIYNPNHLFGFFSVFNADAVSDVNLYKGGFPAQYGGRLSSVLDVGLRSGDMEKFGVTGGLGLISSRLSVEGPILKDKVSFIFSGRRTYFDVFTRAVNRMNAGRRDFNPIPDYYFYDLNGKVTIKPTSRDEITLSGYHGDDAFGFSRDRFGVNFDWGNTAATARWRHTFNRQLTADYRYAYTRYRYQIRNQFDNFSFGLGSGIENQTLSADFFLDAAPKHRVQFGGQYIYHAFDIGRANAGSQDGAFSFQAGTSRYANEMGLYVSDQYDVTDRLRVEGGLRWSGFQEGSQFYQALEPRLSTRYLLREAVSLKFNYARTQQYIHLVTSSGASLPTDLWYPSNNVVAPQQADQVAGGISWLLGDGSFLFTYEAYYKWLNNQVDFRDGANLLINDNLDAEFVFGTGRSYGHEFYVEKKQGRTTGWVGYTLAWTDRLFPDINDGRRFSPRYDRRHDISVVVMHRLSERVNLSGTFVYGTGEAYSLPEGKFFWQDVPGRQGNAQPFAVVPDFQERNNFRLAPYHRMDLSLVWQLQPRWGDSDLTFSIYNTYDRRNAFFVYFAEETNEETGALERIRARQASLFPILPSVTYNFRF